MKSSACQFENVSHASAKKRHGGLVALVFGAALLLWSGCSTPVAQTVAFNEADYKFSETTGTAVIHGHAFVRSDTGVKHGAAGIQVFLVPLTDYTDERSKIMQSGKDPAPADPRLERYTKTVVGDWGGEFKFEGLPAGTFLIFCRIDWERQLPNGHRRDGYGGFYALAKAQIKNGEHKSVVVTNVGQK